MTTSTESTHGSTTERQLQERAQATQRLNAEAGVGRQKALHTLKVLATTANHQSLDLRDARHRQRDILEASADCFDGEADRRVTTARWLFGFFAVIVVFDVLLAREAIEFWARKAFDDTTALVASYAIPSAMLFAELVLGWQLAVTAKAREDLARDYHPAKFGLFIVAAVIFTCAVPVLILYTSTQTGDSLGSPLPWVFALLAFALHGTMVSKGNLAHELLHLCRRRWAMRRAERAETRTEHLLVKCEGQTRQAYEDFDVANNRAKLAGHRERPVYDVLTAMWVNYALRADALPLPAGPMPQNPFAHLVTSAAEDGQQAPRLAEARDGRASAIAAPPPAMADSDNDMQTHMLMLGLDDDG